MKKIWGNFVSKRSVLPTLLALAVFFSLLGVFHSSMKSPKEAETISSSDYETVLTLDSTNKPTTGNTYSGEYTPIAGYTFYYNMATNYSTSVHASLRNNQEGYIANVTPLEGFDYISVNCRATTGTANCNIWASNAYSNSPYDSYTKIASETMSTAAADVTSTISASYKFFAVHVSVSSNSYRNNRLLINSLTLAKSYPLTGIAISRADSIGFANEGEPYDYSVIASYSNGATKDVTKAATLTTSLINTMRLDVQTLGVSYEGFSASKAVRVTNVNAVVGKTIAASTYTDATFNNEDGISTGASLNGKTLRFNPVSNFTTGAWDVACIAATAGSKVWTETKKMTLSSSAKTNYLRGAIYDEHTGLTSPWTLLAEIKPVYDFEAPAINCVNSFSSESTSLFALISQTTITITMYRPACGSAWLGHYRVGTSDSGSYVTVSYPADKEVSTVILTKQNLSGSETNWYVSAYSSCASTSISSPKRSKAIFVPASVAAPSCTHTHAWNSGFFQWRSDSTWKNNSVYNLEKMRIVTQGNAEYDWSYGGMYCTNIAKDETFVPGTSAIGQNAAIESIGQGGGGTFGFSSFCQITYAGVTSKWYQTYCEHDTEINSPTTNFTSSDSITATYRDNTGDYYVYYNFTISGSVYTTTTSYNG
jgi:hypothetical protein